MLITDNILNHSSNIDSCNLPKFEAECRYSLFSEPKIVYGYEEEF